MSSSKPLHNLDESKFRLRGVSAISSRTLSSEKFEIIRHATWPQNHVFVSCDTNSLNFAIKDQFTNMTGPFRIEFICEINLRDSGMEGFINVYDGIYMKRYWCHLSGCSLEFWNDDIDCRRIQVTCQLFNCC